MDIHTPAELEELRDGITTRNYGIAGLAGGVGIASLMGLIDHIKRLNAIKATKQQEQDKLDRLQRIQERALEKEATVNPTAITALALTGVTSLVLTKKLITQALLHNDKKALGELKARYNNKLKERKELLESKTASKGREFSKTESFLSSAAALPILITLGTAIAANQYLKHIDPVDTVKKREKEESSNLDALKLMEDKLANFTLPVVLALQLKAARKGPLGDIVGTVVEGNGSKLAQAMIVDPTTTLDSILGAHKVLEGLDESELTKVASTVWATPSLAPVAMLYAKAELDEHFPFITKVAAAMTDEAKEELQAKVMDKLLEGKEPSENTNEKDEVQFVETGEASDDE